MSATSNSLNARYVIHLMMDESGASSSEYAVLTALVVAAVAAAIAIFDLNVFFGVRDKVLLCVNGGC